jgi:hypothetical protein
MQQMAVQQPRNRLPPGVWTQHPLHNSIDSPQPPATPQQSPPGSNTARRPLTREVECEAARVAQRGTARQALQQDVPSQQQPSAQAHVVSAKLLKRLAPVNEAYKVHRYRKNQVYSTLKNGLFPDDSVAAHEEHGTFDERTSPRASR